MILNRSDYIETRGLPLPNQKATKIYKTKVFKDIGLKTTIDTGATICNFLDVTRVATHSGNSGKLREFLSWRKSQGDSGNSDLFFKHRETQGSYDFF